MLPANVTVARYPAVEIGHDYPTLGPAGLVSMDVNGLAGSIELYLGRDVLEDREGKLRPVQWTGFVRGSQQYQGELLEKSSLVQAFYDKAQIAERHPELRAGQDWSGLGVIVEMLLTELSRGDEQFSTSER